MAGALNKLPVAVSGMIFFSAPVTFFSVTAVLIGSLHYWGRAHYSRIYGRRGVCYCQNTAVQSRQDGPSHSQCYRRKRKQSQPSRCRKAVESGANYIEQNYFYICLYL